MAAPLPRAMPGAAPLRQAVLLGTAPLREAVLLGAAPLRRAVLLGAAALLLGCGAAPVEPQWRVAPLLRLQHADGVDAAALYRLGRYHQQRGELDAAAVAFARSLALDPAQLDARNAKAVLLASQGRLEQAATLLRQLAQDFPDQAQPLSNLGYVYYLQGLHSEAVATLEQALRRAPGHAQASANLALTRALAADGSGPATTTAAGGPAVAMAAAAPAAVAPAPLAMQAGQRLVQVAPNIFQLEARADAAASGNVAAAPIAASDASASAGAPTVQIVNGNGVTGLGERTRRLLARQGIADATVVNQRGHTQRATVIEYLPARRADAERMRAALRGPARLLRVASLPGPLTLRLVLGSDQAAPAARKAAAPRRIAQRTPARPAPIAHAALLSLASAAPHFTQE